MKPPPFDYAAPHSLEEALALCSEYGDDAKLLAGGQSLIPLLNFRLTRPKILIDLNRVGGLDYVEESPDGGLRIGAMTRQSRLESHPAVAGRAPLMQEAIPFVAHPQIRNRGTIGGNLAHADPASELPAVAVALDARFKLVGPLGSRTVAARDFYVSLMTTCLRAGEILAAVELPRLEAGSGHCFMEVARRHGDYAQVGIAAQLVLDSGERCRHAELVYLSAGDRPFRAVKAAHHLRSGLDEATVARAAREAAQEIEPTDDIQASADFKRHLAEVLTRRAVMTAIARARGSYRSLQDGSPS